MNDEIRSIVDTLEPSGVYDTANLLDPASITQIALNLAGTTSVDEFSLWLTYYADSREVSKSDLATDVLMVLSRCIGFVDARIVNAAGKEARQMASV